MKQETSSPKQIMLINMGGNGNIGDRAMAMSILQHLRAHRPDARILVGPHTPDFIIDEFDLQRYPFLSHCMGRLQGLRKSLRVFPLGSRIFEALYFSSEFFVILVLLLLRRYIFVPIPWNFSEAALTRAIAESDSIFFCGGGYLADIGAFDARTNLLMAILGLVARKPVIMSGQGIGPLDSWLTKLLVRIVVPRVQLITYRDKQGTADLLASLDVQPPEGSGPTGDDAMLLQAGADSTATPQDDGRVRIGVNFRVSPFTQNLKGKVNEFAKFLTLVENENKWDIEFFVFETWRTWERDVLADLIRESGIVRYKIHSTEDPREALLLTQHCHVTIGIAYHFIVFSLRLGVPSLALYGGDWYRAKMVGLLEWYGRTEWAVPTDSLIAEDLFSRVADLAENRSHHSESLRSTTQALAQECRITFEKAVSYL